MKPKPYNPVTLTLGFVLELVGLIERLLASLEGELLATAEPWTLCLGFRVFGVLGLGFRGFGFRGFGCRGFGVSGFWVLG